MSHQGGRNNLGQRLYDSGPGISLLKLTGFLPNMITRTSEVIVLPPAPAVKDTLRVYVPLWLRFAFLNTSVAPSVMLYVWSRITGTEARKLKTAKPLAWVDPDLVKDHSTPKISDDENFICHGSLTGEPGSQYVALPSGNEICAKRIKKNKKNNKNLASEQIFHLMGERTSKQSHSLPVRQSILSDWLYAVIVARRVARNFFLGKGVVSTSSSFWRWKFSTLQGMHYLLLC